MNFINLTPHAINLIDGPSFPPSGNVARVAVSRQLVVKWNEVKLFAPSFGEVEGLPEPQEDTAFIVSALVRTALPDREDLLSPGNLVRDDKGAVIGCDGFDSNF